MENKDIKIQEEELETDSDAQAEGQPDCEEQAAAEGAAEESDDSGEQEGSKPEDGVEEAGEDAAEDGDMESDAKEEAVKEGVFRKKKKDKKEEAYKARIDELEDRVKRQMAEFENFRKRTDKEKAAMFETGARSVIEKVLPVVDNFERGLAAVPENEKESAFVEGMNKIYKQLMTELDNMGVKPIEAVGQEFDPNYHNAVMHIEDENYGENIVAEEFQKGYTYHDVVVRHSMVKVAN
jgi:molecular chaperone GrpE